VEGSCEHGNEPLGAVKFWEIHPQFHALVTSVGGMINFVASTRGSLSFEFHGRVRE
jgi:hypothetical protein